MTTEFATVEDNDVESLVCVCGNHGADEGLIAATAEGIAVHISETPVPEGLAPYPENVDDVFTLCPVCGHLYNDKTIRDTNTAPVVLKVDVTNGTRHKDAIIAHWAELDKG